MAKSQGRIIAEGYHKKFPNTPTATLAKKLYNENSRHFNDVEHARTVLRTVRGQHGDHHRKFTGHKKEDLKYNYNPFKIPESFATERKPFKLPTACNNVLYLSDLHIPYHDIKALTAALNYGKAQNVNTIFFNGDVMDFCKISRFETDPYKRSVKQELDTAREILGIIRKEFPDASMYWLKGNHDVRLEHYLRVKAPELLDIEEFQLAALLRLNELRITIIEDDTLVKIGKLSVTHGHHVMRGFFAPVNSARGVYMRAKQSTIIGHVHKVSTHSETNMDGDVVTTWSTGCLCELKPDYNPLISNYSHGFAHIKVEGSGNYKVLNHQIINGEVY